MQKYYSKLFNKEKSFWKSTIVLAFVTLKKTLHIELTIPMKLLRLDWGPV